MGHGNARLTFHGRRLLVQRVRDQHMPVAHVGRAMGISRQCAHRWVARFDAEGEAGLHDRSSRPRRMPTRTSPEADAMVLAARVEHRRGQDWLGPELGIPARTVSRILRRHGVPRLATCDPMTGEVIRASKTAAVRYEPGLASCSTWTSRRSGGSPPVVAGELTASRSGRTSRRGTPASASTTSIPWSMTTAESRTRRSTTTRRPPRVRRSSPEPSSTSPPPSGPTGRASPSTTSEPPPLPPGSRTTTLNDATALSVASRRSAARSGRRRIPGKAQRGHPLSAAQAPLTFEIGLRARGPCIELRRDHDEKRPAGPRGLAQSLREYPQYSPRLNLLSPSTTLLRGQGSTKSERASLLACRVPPAAWRGWQAATS